MTLHHNQNDTDNCNDLTSYIQGLQDIRRSGQLCDVTICCGDDTFPAHKVVLAANCPYLRAMFTNGMIESTRAEIHLKQISSKTWSSIMDFIYTRSTSITNANVLDLVRAASMLQIEALREKCSRFLARKIEVNNVLKIRDFAEQLFVEELQVAATSFLTDNFEKVIEQDEFLELSHTKLADILQFDFLRVRSEYVPLYGALRWLQHDLAEREEHAFLVLQHIRLLHFTSPAYVQRVVEQLPQHLRSAEECEKFLESIRRSKRRLIGSLQEDMLSYPRWFPQESIYVSGGRNKDSCLSSLESYDSSSNSWSVLESMQSQRTAVSMAPLSNHIYCLGGERENPKSRSQTLYLDEVERYSPQFNRWTQVCKLTVPRSFGAAAVCRETMYAVGGEDSQACHDSTETYDESRNTWLLSSPMTVARSGVCVTTIEHRIYAIGGHDNYNNYTQHSSVEALDPREGRWQRCMGLNIGRSGATAASIDGRIYLAGGRNRQLGNFFGLCECYEPRIDRWHPVASMSSVRAWPGSAVLDKKLVVLGGYDCTDRLPTVEMYDPVEDRWQRCGNMMMCRAGAAACTI